MAQWEATPSILRRLAKKQLYRVKLVQTFTDCCLFFYYTEHTLVESHQIGLSEGDEQLASQFPKILNENEAAISSAFDETEITAAWTDIDQRPTIDEELIRANLEGTNWSRVEPDFGFDPINKRDRKRQRDIQSSALPGSVASTNDQISLNNLPFEDNFGRRKSRGKLSGSIPEISQQLPTEDEIAESIPTELSDLPFEAIELPAEVNEDLVEQIEPVNQPRRIRKQKRKGRRGNGRRRPVERVERRRIRTRVVRVDTDPLPPTSANTSPKTTTTAASRPTTTTTVSQTTTVEANPPVTTTTVQQTTTREDSPTTTRSSLIDSALSEANANVDRNVEEVFGSQVVAEYFGENPEIASYFNL